MKEIPSGIYSGGEAQPGPSDRHCDPGSEAGFLWIFFREEPAKEKSFFFLGEEKIFYFPSPLQLLRFDSKQVCSLIELCGVD